MTLPRPMLFPSILFPECWTCVPDLSPPFQAGPDFTAPPCAYVRPPCERMPGGGMGAPGGPPGGGIMGRGAGITGATPAPGPAAGGGGDEPPCGATMTLT